MVEVVNVTMNIIRALLGFVMSNQGGNYMLKHFLLTKKIMINI